MTLLQDAERLTPAELLRHQQAAWESQRDHVANNSAFYKALWQGQDPPRDLRDLPALPLSDKAQLRLSQAEHPPFGDYLAAPRSAVTRLHRTRPHKPPAPAKHPSPHIHRDTMMW